MARPRPSQAGQRGAALIDDRHAARVDAWLGQAARDLAPVDLLRLFDAAMGTLWARTRTTLGDVTLGAIGERVLHHASDKFPQLSALGVDPARGIQCEALAEQLGTVPEAELRTGIRFVLVQFLTVLGHLTAEILTEQLHAELSRVALPKQGRTKRAAPPRAREGKKR